MLLSVALTLQTSRSFRSKLIRRDGGGLLVGTRTIVDVLDATTTLYNASKSWQMRVITT